MRLKLIFVVFMLSLIVMAPVQAMGILTIDKTLAVDESPSSPNNVQTFTLTLSPTPTATTTTAFSTNGQCAIANENENASTGGAIVSDDDSFNMRVEGVDDEEEEGSHSCIINFVTSSSDPNYTNSSLTVVASVADDGDTQFIPSYSLIQTGGGSLEEGASNIYTYRVQMNRAAVDPVIVQAFGGTNCQLLQGSPQVRVDSSEQTIAAGGTTTGEFTLTARQDDLFEGFHSCIISHTTSTIDQAFDGVSVPPLIVAVKDDDKSDLQLQNQSIEDAELQEELLGRGLLDLFDANNDGIEDSTQENVQSFINQVSGTRHAIEVEGCDLVGSIVSRPNSQLPSDDSLHFPYGTMEFMLECDSVGGQATIRWLLDQTYPTSYPWLLRKVDVNGRIDNILSAGFSTKELQNGSVSVVSYDIIDGGPLDADGEANGVIVDPVGLALPLSLIGSSVEQEDSSSNSGLTKAIQLSLISLAVILIVTLVLTKPDIKSRITKRITGDISDEPKIDKY